MSMLFALLSITASCVPSANPAQNPSQVVHGFFDAINDRDHDRIGSYLKPGAEYVTAPGQPSMDLADLLGGLPEDGTFEVLSFKLNSNRLAVIRTRTSEGAERDAHVRLDGGCITAIENLGQN